MVFAVALERLKQEGHTVSEIVSERLLHIFSDAPFVFFVACGLAGTGMLLMKDHGLIKKIAKKNKDGGRLRWDVGDLMKLKEGNRWLSGTITSVEKKNEDETSGPDDMLQVEFTNGTKKQLARSSKALKPEITKDQEDKIISELVGLFEKYKDSKSQRINKINFRKLCLECRIPEKTIPFDLFNLDEENIEWKELRKPKFIKILLAHEKKKKKKKSVQSEELMRILRICIPKPFSKEMLSLLVQFCLLVSRSLISVRITSLFGTMLQAVSKRKFHRFLRVVFHFAVLGMIGSFVNSSLKHLDNCITMYFRRRLTRYIHNLYLQNRSYYHLSNLCSTLDNPDQRITQDINNFCKGFSGLYSHTFKPFLDFVLNTAMLYQNTGTNKVGFMQVYFVLAFAIVKGLSPAFGKMIGQKQALEGHFQREHARLLIHSEEIAFIEGDEREQQILNQEFDNVYNFDVYRFWNHWKQGCVDNWVLKYQASLIGWPLISLGFIFSDDPLSTESLARYRVSEILMQNSSSAFGECLMCYKKVQKMGGYSSRVIELLDVLEERAKKTKGQNKNDQFQIVNDVVAFENLTFCAPDKTPLLNNFNLEIKPGHHVLITGKNGAGKSSLFRIMAGLWKPLEGNISRPLTYVDNDPKKGANLYYVPQKPYLVTGCLRDQVTYPILLGPDEEDERVRKCLEETGLHKFVKANLDQKYHDWSSVLSGGEKQRMGFARLFFHNPTFAILDEATSAVEPKGQTMLYEKTKGKGITMISIAHRHELIKYHDQHIEFLGHGNFEDCTNKN